MHEGNDSPCKLSVMETTNRKTEKGVPWNYDQKIQEKKMILVWKKATEVATNLHNFECKRTKKGQDYKKCVLYNFQPTFNHVLHIFHRVCST